MSKSLEKEIADIESLRLKEIEFHGLKNTDGIYTIFYDETNNIRKLYLTENGQLNVEELNNFVLGGIAYCGEYKAIDLKHLRSNLRLQDNVKDLKLKNIAKGTFLNVIDSKRMAFFLSFLKENDFFIHYSHIDLMYWSIVDIIDSIIPDELQAYVFTFKTDLYEIIKCDIENAVSILSRYNYPDISTEGVDGFLRDMHQIICMNRANLAKRNLESLKFLFSKNHKELPFIQGYKSRQLIENFNAFYRQRLITFKNATHVFDDEPVVVELFKNDSWVNNARDGRFHFTTSHGESCIQLSDVVVGLLGKMYSYLRYSNYDQIKSDRSKLGKVGIDNLDILSSLLNKTETISLGFIHHCASIIDIQKTKILFTKDNSL